MGVDLRGEGGELHLGWPAWSYCLSVAHAFGWEPEGTKPPMFDPPYPNAELQAEAAARWDGGYFTNDYQHVTDSDAKALAAALDRAVAAVEASSACTVDQMKALAGGDDEDPASM